MPASYKNRPEAQQQRIAELQELAQSRGGLFLSSEYISSKTKYAWQCSKGHTWDSSVDSVKGQNSWCPQCAGNTQRTIEQLRSIIETRGGRLLTEEYRGVDGSYDFLCNLGHQNRNIFKKIEAGQWCSTCNKTSKSEEITRAILENLFGSPFPKKRPKWLRNSRGRQMELDGYSEDLQVAFEYQGAQHFKDVGIYPGSLPQRISDDELKSKLCSENNVRLLVFTYLEDFSDFHVLARSQLNGWDQISKFDFTKPVNFEKAYIRSDRLQDLKDLLKPKKIEVLSKKWVSVNTAYAFQCLVCGSEWEAQGNAFFNSRRVAGCDYCNRRVPANKKSLEYAAEYAKKHKGKLVSTEYLGRRAKYEFVCSRKHPFSANLNNLMHRDQFCPFCEKRKTRRPFPTAEELGELLGKRKLELVSNRPSRFQDEIVVKCLRCENERAAQLRSVLNSRRSCLSCDPPKKPNL